MSEPLTHPPFGQADLTNCERELIHLAGSIQPHGALIVLRESDLAVVQASANVEGILGLPLARLLDSRAASLGRAFESGLRRLVASTDLSQPQPMHCPVDVRGQAVEFDVIVHRVDGAGLVVEFEAPMDGVAEASFSDLRLKSRLASTVERLSSASSIQALSEAAVQSFREIVGYDRVMVYKFDSDGHGEIVAEARDMRLESFLGLHYPATDIPQRARELYVRNRARVLVDVDYVPVAVTPRTNPTSGTELDMSLCHLRSMSPLHTQYLRNMGVTATLVVSLVRESGLWGLIACHHYSPRRIPYVYRLAAELLGEVISTRIAAIENYAHAQVALLVRRMEQRLIEATATEGDWRHALLRSPGMLLQPLEASGAALFYEGEILTSGDVPSTPELRALATWVAGRTEASFFSCSSVARENPALRSLTPTASGVIAIELAPGGRDYLMWFRQEQLSTVTWAGDPAKPIAMDDPRELSPRRSFAAWSQMVRETAAPWSSADLALARAIGSALADIIVQVHAVRLLVTEHQFRQVRAAVAGAKEPVVIAERGGRVIICNDAFQALFDTREMLPNDLQTLAARFDDPEHVRRIFDLLRAVPEPWRGELGLVCGPGRVLPVALRADMVPGPNGTVLGFILILTDLSGPKKAERARQHLEHLLYQVAHPDLRVEDGRPVLDADEVVSAIIANASIAALDIADGAAGEAVAPLFEELEISAQRAAGLYGRLRAYLRRD